MKKHLSKIILGRSFLVSMGTFLALMAFTVLFIYIHAEKSAESFVRSSLADIDYYTSGRMDRVYRWDTEDYCKWFDQYIAERSSGDRSVGEEVDWVIGDPVEPGAISELDLISPDGIVISSSEKGNKGIDLHSNEKAAEFLCLFDGKTDIYKQDMVLNQANGSLMKYYGGYLPDYGGILLVGINREDFDESRKTNLEVIIQTTKFGRTGFYLFLDNDFKILSSPGFVHNDEVLSLTRDIVELAESGAVVKDKVYGVPSFIGVSADNNNYIISVYPISEAWETWNILILVLLMIYAVIFTVLFLMFNRLLSKKVVNGVYSINNSLGLISRGKLDEKADFRDSVEFDGLSDGINLTVDRLRSLIKEAADRIDAELALAAKIQTSFLPDDFPAFPEREEFGLYASMVPAKEVGGDFYDFFFIDDDHLALVMGDVSGKGIPAALFMVTAMQRIRDSIKRYGTDVAEAIGEVNNALLKENDAKLFVTVWAGVLTVSTGHIDYVDAGHEYPAISRNGGEFRADKDIHSAPVAAFKNMRFKTGTLDLCAGDILFLYTDGVTEARNPENEMFRVERMLEALNRNRTASPEELDVNLRTAIAGFVKDAPQFDDTTTLCFRYKG